MNTSAPTPHSPRPRRTWVATQAQLKDRRWYVVDLKGLVLGRTATQIASVLRGKHKPTFTPHVDAGDFVIALNADQVVLTGGKMEKKVYHHHTGFAGGLVTRTAEQLLARDPETVIRRAVWGMLPKGPLGRKLIKKLKIYRGSEHPHEAQQPEPLPMPTVPGVHRHA